MCSGSGLLTSGKKHELVERVAENTPGKSEPVAYLNETDLYYGKIGSIPNSTTGLMRLSVAQLRAILRQHQILELGTKEELITRVGLLKAGYPEAAFSRERLCILHMVEVAIKITSTQEELSSKSFRRKRKFAHGQETESRPGRHASKTSLPQKHRFSMLKTNKEVYTRPLTP